MKYYLTKEGKEEIKLRITSTEAKLDILSSESIVDSFPRSAYLAQLGLLNIILQNSIVLPEYNSWEDVEIYPPDNEGQNNKTLRDINGVIIKNRHSN